MDHSKRDPGSIGQRLRQQRQKRGMNQQDLVSPDISASYISLIETGKRVPSEGVLESLAERVGCSVEYLRTGRDDYKVKELELKIAFGDMALRGGSTGEALEAYSEALTAVALLDDAARRRARIGQALALEGLGRLEPALALLSELFADRETVAGSAEWGQIAIALTRCYRDAGDLVLSVEIGERALRALDALGLDATDDHWRLGSVLIDCYRLRGDLTRAHMLADRLLATAEQPGSPVARGTVYWNAALVAQARHRTDEALTLAERALMLMSETDSAHHQAVLKKVCGELLLDSGREQALQAKQMLEQAQEVMVAVGTTLEQARGDIALAKALLALGEPDRAAEHASRALGLLRSQRPHQGAEARTVLAQAQFDRGQADRAHASLRAAERQLELLAPARSNAEVWRRIADLWHRHGQVPEALTAYQKALTQAGVPADVSVRATPPAVR
jgi:tetratricopeptide (TPR) repeat protein